MSDRRIYRAIVVKFPTGVVEVGWGRDLAEAATYAFRARALPWCIHPERHEMHEVKERFNE